MSKDNILLPPFNFFQKGYTAAGLAYAILQHPELGHLCGYVRLPKGHPLYARMRAKRYALSYLHRRYQGTRRGYTVPAIAWLEVHGGVTFAGAHGHYRLNRGVWVGFDCAHLDDLVPGLPPFDFLQKGGTFCTPEYVRAECDALAQQLKGASHG